MHRPLRSLALVAAFTTGLISSQASADEEVQKAQIIMTPGSPVTLTHCTFNGLQTTSNAINRTKLFLQSFTVRWTAFDHSGNPMGQRDDYFDFNSDLAPGDSTLKTNSYRGTLLSEPGSSLATWHCRMQAAKFEGGKSWTYGHAKWPARLSPLPTSNVTMPSNEVVRGVSSEPSSNNSNSSTPSNVVYTVSNAWNDSTSSGIIVHVAIDVKGNAKEFTLRPNDVTLKLALANGAKKSYLAMTQAAPSYDRINALNGQIIKTAEVDPQNDLGNLGSILVPSNGTVRITASFFVGSDVLANPQANREVSIR